MIPPRYPDAERAERVRKLLALEISRIVEDLDARRDFLIDMWSLHRKREPFLETVFSRWDTLGFPMLAELTTEEVAVVDAFYREIDEFRLYISFTQDMPTTLADRYDWICQRITAYGELATEALGGVPDRPLVEFSDESDPEAALLEFPAERVRPTATAPDPEPPGAEPPAADDGDPQEPAGDDGPDDPGPRVPADAD